MSKNWREWPILKLMPEQFPAGLKRVRPAVKQLYYRGKWDKKLFKRAVAVVGARRMTHYGETMTKKIVSGLAEAGYATISGFMYGVDTAAHKSALENRGKTAAVLGCGLNCLTPTENDGLYTRILESGGLVVSEFEPEQEAKLWTFPYRNRIVVGLSRAVVVVEAGEKSGSLVTAKWAIRFKVPILAVPGPATSSLSVGTNWLLKHGAKLATEAGDVLEILGESIQGSSLQALRAENLSKEEKLVVELLEREEMDCDGICRELGWSADKAGIILSGLNLKGVIEDEKGRFNLKT